MIKLTYYSNLNKIGKPHQTKGENEKKYYQQFNTWYKKKDFTLFEKKN